MVWYAQLGQFIQALCPRWRVTQQRNLALLAHALLVRRRLTITDLARAFPCPPQPKVPQPKHGLLHRVKRLWRFLAHPALDETTLRAALARLACSACRSPGPWLPLLVDLTYFDPFAVFAVTIPHGGRALPVAWRAFRRDLAGEPVASQNHLVAAALRALLQALPDGLAPVLVADREFARASFFRFCRANRAQFVVRVDALTWVSHPSYTGPLGRLPLRPGGRRHWLPDARYGKAEREPVHLLAVWTPGQREPWFLASDLADPRAVERWERKRMKVEHGFRDWKHTLRLRGRPRVRLARHLERLLLGVVVLSWSLCLLGARLARPPTRAAVTAWGPLSHFALALELVTMGHPAVAPTTHRLAQWAAGKLESFHVVCTFLPWDARTAHRSG